MRADYDDQEERLMAGRRKDASAEFGGPWTLEKLGILERYLNTYTTALKYKRFKLWYIDAFAGSGRIDLPGDGETRSFLEGSAARAIGIRDKQFDKLVFVEKDASRCDELRNLAEDHPDRDIDIENAEANEYLADLDSDWRGRRGVLFLDPYATAVEWATIKKIARLKALDTWILFPTSALSRMLPIGKRPDDVDPRWARRLTKIYGDDSWRNLYKSAPTLFGETSNHRQTGIDGLLSIYKENLGNLFGRRFLKESRPLMNSKNSVLFEFIFCAGHPRGVNAAHNIARHIVEKL